MGDEADRDQGRPLGLLAPSIAVRPGMGVKADHRMTAVLQVQQLGREKSDRRNGRKSNEEHRRKK